ncbi:PfkB family carbohydrate kinase, partial [Streptomyces sp. NPDC005463]|uniref:PfkB family carbohydrate kinase n=1 Tax=Streptomyces sp. NPDC005463 TaxID=3154465 RepID=UPI0033AE85C9
VRHTEPAPRVDVVAAVGAGDAFAAGYLSGTLSSRPRPSLLPPSLAPFSAVHCPGLCPARRRPPQCSSSH